MNRSNWLDQWLSLIILWWWAGWPFECFFNLGMNEIWNFFYSKGINLLLVFSALVTGLLAVIWNSKNRRFDGIIIVRIKPEVKNDSVLRVSFGNHFFAFISQIFNVSVIVALPSVKVLPIAIFFACKGIVLLI